MQSLVCEYDVESFTSYVQELWQTAKPQWKDNSTSSLALSAFHIAFSLACKHIPQLISPSWVQPGAKATAAVSAPLLDGQPTGPDSDSKDVKETSALQPELTSRAQSSDNPAASLPADSAKVQSYTIPAAQWRDQTGRQARFMGNSFQAVPKCFAL